MNASTPAAPGWRLNVALLWRTGVFVLAIAIIVVIFSRWTLWEGRAGWQTTDDAYLQADVTPIAAKVAGYVRRVPVQDFEKVRAGQVVAQIVDDDYISAASQADANLAGAIAQEKALEAQQNLQRANVSAANAVVAAAAASVAQNERDLDRQQKLLESGSSTTEAAERLRTSREQLSAQLAQNRAQSEAASRLLEVLAAQIDQAEATISAQRASAQIAHINLGYTLIVAPQDGVLGQRQVQQGQYVGVGAQVTTLTPLPHVWVVANYKETQLTHMSVGNAAKISVDTFPEHDLRGHVVAFAPASGSQFSLLPPDNATGNFTKVVQRITVKIVIDDADGLADKLRPGMSVVTHVDSRDGAHE